MYIPPDFDKVFHPVENQHWSEPYFLNTDQARLYPSFFEGMGDQICGSCRPTVKLQDLAWGGNNDLNFWISYQQENSANPIHMSWFFDLSGRNCLRATGRYIMARQQIIALSKDCLLYTGHGEVGLYTGFIHCTDLFYLPGFCRPWICLPWIPSIMSNGDIIVLIHLDKPSSKCH